MVSYELDYLKLTKSRLMVWMMQDIPAVSTVHEWVARGYKDVSKACQIMSENEEDEREGSRDDDEGV